MPFDAKAATYSLDNARVLGQAAAIAYQGPQECRAWAVRNGFEDLSFEFFSSPRVFLASDTQGFIAQNQDAIIVAFRGTQPGMPADWLDDFQASHETWGHPAGTVHKGFYEALRAVWGARDGHEILPKRLIERGNRTVWVAGHSLGGALAMLCAAQAFFVHHVPIQGCYTFGQPRVGSESFAKAVHNAFGARVYRHINDRDIVARVPLFSMRYRHYGAEIFFDHSGARAENTHGIENLAGALRLLKGALNLDPLETAARLMKEAILDAGFLGDPAESMRKLMRRLEETAVPNLKTLAKSSVENISDHDMNQNYLKLLGASL